MHDNAGLWAAALCKILVARNYQYPSKWTKGLITKLFATSIHEGALGLQFADDTVVVGSGRYAGTIAPPSLPRLIFLLLRPDYRIPSYYTEGFWCCEKGKLYEVLELLTTQKRSPLHLWFRFFARSPIRDKIVYRLFPMKVKESIARHYNTSPDFMKLILGERLEYTCAFFDSDHVTLEEAQDNKVDTIIRRLAPSNGQRVLDMGCGWGQIAEAVSRKTGAKVTEINLSKNQIKFAQDKRSSARLEFIVTDYETFHPDEKFDLIYSIGMLEHVGRGLLDNYFSKIYELLAPRGRALVHCIVRRRPGSTNSWIDDQVFPGAYIPQVSEIVDAIDRSKLQIEKLFAHDRRNYFRTLLAWVSNFYSNEDKLEGILSNVVAPDDLETIMKIWEFYLQGSRLVFNEKSGYCYNVQIVLRRSEETRPSRPTIAPTPEASDSSNNTKNARLQYPKL